MRRLPAALALITLLVLGYGCSDSTSPTDLPLSDDQSPTRLLAMGGDPDGVGIDFAVDPIAGVTDIAGQAIAPGAALPDETLVIVICMSGRVETTTWGKIKGDYHG